jgi:hypothetical protein
MPWRIQPWSTGAMAFEVDDRMDRALLRDHETRLVNMDVSPITLQSILQMLATRLDPTSNQYALCI